MSSFRMVARPERSAMNAFVGEVRLRKKSSSNSYAVSPVPFS
jgi:hypothetical protein